MGRMVEQFDRTENQIRRVLKKSVKIIFLKTRAIMCQQPFRKGFKLLKVSAHAY